MVEEGVLGWDGEWFDPFATSSFMHTIQISGEKRIWIIDGVWMIEAEEEERNAINSLLSILMANKFITHVFMGKDDIMKLQKCFFLFLFHS